MRKFLLTLSFAVLLCTGVKAQSFTQTNEVRFGIGDCMAEALFYRASVHKDYSDLPEGKVYTENRNYHYLPHFFLEYYRTLRPWLSVGAQFDSGSFYWKSVNIAGGTNEILGSRKQNCSNIAIMPAARFNWYRKNLVMLFSTVRAGLAINTGSEKNYLGQKTSCGIALDPTLIGCCVGGEHWNGAVELGGLFAFKNTNELYIAGSKLISLSVGYKF